MLRIAKSIAAIYSGINSDLLFTGVILHDIAKIKEFETNNLGLVTDYTVEGKLLGHISMGSEYVAAVCDRCSVDPEIKLLLKHMILSHHGKPEHGSAVTPSFLEAELLYICDYTDSRVYMYKEATSNINPGEFSPKIFGLDNKQIYKPKEIVNDNNPMIFIEDNISDLF
jgi:3'-5' exoribonuclease